MPPWVVFTFLRFENTFRWPTGKRIQKQWAKKGGGRKYKKKMHMWKERNWSRSVVSDSVVSHGGPCNPMDRSLPGSSVHGIFQARILEWVAISFFRGSSQPRDQTWVSCIAGRQLTVWATREVLDMWRSLYFKQIIWSRYDIKTPNKNTPKNYILDFKNVFS